MFSLDRGKRLLLSFAVCIAVFSLMILTDAPGDTVDDDWLIACYLSPSVPDGDMCLFLNALLAQFVSHLGNLLTDVNCYQVLELVVSFVAFLCFVYYATKYLKIPYSLFLLCSLVFFALPGCTYLQKFAMVAGTTALIGFFLLVICFCEDDSAAGVIGGALIIMGMLIRQDAVMATVPFLLGVCLFVFFRHPDKEKRASSTKRLVAIALIVVVFCMALDMYDAHVWEQSPWAEWSTYNSVRSSLSDFRIPPYDEVSTELTALGFSENDYKMMKNWMVSDTSVFTFEKLQEVVRLQAAYPGPSVETVLYKTIEGLSQEPVMVVVIAMTVVLFPLSRCTDKLAWAALIAACAGAFLMCVYLQWRGRLLPRISYMVWLNFIFSAVLILQYARVEEGAHHASKSMSVRLVLGRVVSVGIVVVCAGLTLRTYAPAVSEFNAFGFLNYSIESADSHDYLNLYQGVEAVDEDSTRFVYQARARKILEREYKLKTIPNVQYFTHNIALGEWAVESPQLRAIYEEVGWRNPYQGLLEDEDAVLVVTDESFADMTRIFLQEHYDTVADYSYIGSSVAHDAELRLYRFSTGGHANDVAG